MAAQAAKVAQRVEAAREHGATLDLSECELISLPQAVGFMLKEVPIVHCSLAFNLLKGLSAKINTLTMLRELCLRHNKLTSISAQVHLPHLEALDLSHNQFTALPEAVFSFSSLKRLTATHNEIDSVELAPFEQLPALEQLDLDDNRLTPGALQPILSQLALPAQHRRF